MINSVKDKIEKLLLFLVSPFLAIPYVLIDIKNNSKGSLFILAALGGIACVLYEPFISDDKYYYLKIYESFRVFSFNEFIRFIILESTDFLFYYIIYLFSHIGIGTNSLFFIFGFITYYLILKVYFNITQEYVTRKNELLVGFLTLFFSMELIHILSGVRFYFAVSILLYGIYFSFFKNKSLIGFFLMIIAVLTHFSSIIFLIGYIIFLLFKRKNKILNTGLVLSFTFIILPTDFILMVTDFIGFSGIFKAKIESYLSGESDLVSSGVKQGNQNNIIKLIIDNLWLIPCYLFIFKNRKWNHPLKNILIVFLMINNFFMIAPDVFMRYSVVTKKIMVFLLPVIPGNLLNSTIKYGLASILFLSTLANFIAMRMRFSESIFHLKSYNIFTLLLE